MLMQPVQPVIWRGLIREVLPTDFRSVYATALERWPTLASRPVRGQQLELLNIPRDT
ncbi:MAG TPA: hypothetical protein PKY77_15045 [Phycisphaerae bacterium]|nr:hypothetical protein [Phycisphaerae bacterium]HRY70440.1 hypothetical protein [Phycisphaerae bacterium]HSA27674.1 hypothetical protein [Phycisphaerae bacterium]